MKKEVVLTGLRTNGAYHLGNYIGALLPMTRLVERGRTDQKYQINLFAPDLHSFTTPVDFKKLYQQTVDNLHLFVAAGIPLDDPDVNLYRQSRISAHSELTWILSNFASFGDLSRMIEFKEKSSSLNKDDRVKVGLFIYPILMAADILLYDATWVPVGDDQRQHLEFCRRLAKSFNQQFGSPVFTIPASFEKQQVWLQRTEAPRIRNLRHPQKKMSKSVVDERGTIMLSDKAEIIAKKIMAATTDNLAQINYDWRNQPGITNLLTILASLQSKPQAEINQQWLGGSDYHSLKLAATEVVQTTLNQLQIELNRVSSENLMAHLKHREETLGVLANQKLVQIQQILGLRK